MTSYSGEFWWKNAGGGWATATVLLLLLFWQLLRLMSRRRTALAGDESPVPRSSECSIGSSSAGASKLITEADLEDLIDSLEGKLKEGERWEDVIDKKGELVSYKAKSCRPKDGPLKYLSVTTFEKCSTELLRDFYMDNEYRKDWDKTLISHEQLQVDESNGIEVGRTIKKFPFLTPREYILAWSTWEGKDRTFYCFIKDCEHPLAPQGKKYVRVGFLRSGWRIRKVPGRYACEITMVYQEDAGMNIEMAKLAFSKGIWSYVSKMNRALRDYSPLKRRKSVSVLTLLRLIKKVPPEFESNLISHQSPPESSGRVFGRQQTIDVPEKTISQKSAKLVTNGLLLLGGVVCLSRGNFTLGTQLAIACILKKLMKPATDSSQVRAPQDARARRDRRHVC